MADNKKETKTAAKKETGLKQRSLYLVKGTGKSKHIPKGVEKKISGAIAQSLVKSGKVEVVKEVE